MCGDCDFGRFLRLQFARPRARLHPRHLPEMRVATFRSPPLQGSAGLQGLETDAFLSVWVLQRVCLECVYVCDALWIGRLPTRCSYVHSINDKGVIKRVLLYLFHKCNNFNDAFPSQVSIHNAKRFPHQKKGSWTLSLRGRVRCVFLTRTSCRGQWWRWRDVLWVVVADMCLAAYGEAFLHFLPDVFESHPGLQEVIKKK